MPTGTSIQQFVNDLRDRKSKVARALQDLFGTEAALTKLKGHRHLDELRPNGALGPPLLGWVEDELRGKGWSGLVTNEHKLGNKDIDHINEWTQQKDALRVKLVDSIDADPPLPLEFFWELTDGGQEIVMPPIGSAGDVTFRSPRDNITVSTLNYGDITVTV